MGTKVTIENEGEKGKYKDSLMDANFTLDNIT